MKPLVTFPCQDCGGELEATAEYLSTHGVWCECGTLTRPVGYGAGAAAAVEATLGPGERIVNGERMYSSAFLNDRPSEQEHRRRQADIAQFDRSRRAGRRGRR